MNQLTSIRSDLQVATQLQHKFRADETVRSYQTGAKQFRDYCVANDVPSLPASAETVCSFLASLVQSGKSVSTIQSRLHAIKWLHKTAGLASPVDHPAVEMTLDGIRRQLKVAPRQAKALLAEDIKLMLNTMKSNNIIRDRAVILLGYYGGFRRSELASIRRSDLTFSGQGVIVHLAQSKTDQIGEGRDVAIARQDDPRFCPVVALQAWMLEHDDERALNISDRTVWNIINRACKNAGFDPAGFSSHSLRAGLVTQARLNGADKRDIRAITGHKSDQMIDRYTRVVDAWENNATKGLI